MANTDARVSRNGSPARELLRWQFRLAHELVEDALERLSTRSVDRMQRDTSASVAAWYAQVVLCEDFSVNGVLADGTPLAFSSWAGRTGLSRVPPLGEWSEWRGWARQLHIDLANVRRYANAVYASTDTCIANLSDELLDPSHSEGPACLLSALLMTLSMRRGELTGLQDQMVAHARLPPTTRVSMIASSFWHPDALRPRADAPPAGDDSTPRRSTARATR